MKNLFAILLSAALLALSGCAAPAAAEKAPLLARAELTEAEQNILDLAGVEDPLHLYSFHAGEEIQSAEIALLLLQDGAWKREAGSAFSLDSPSGRIALTFREDGSRRIALSDGSGFTAWDSGAQPHEPSEGIGRAAAWEDSLDIAPNVPLPLMIEYASSGNSLAACSPDAVFSKPETLEGYDSVRAVTVTFYDHPLS